MLTSNCQELWIDSLLGRRSEVMPDAPSIGNSVWCRQLCPSLTNRLTDEIVAVAGSRWVSSASTSSSTRGGCPWATVRCGMTSANCPPVGRRLRPSRRDGLGQRTKRLIRRRSEVKHVGEAAALVEPDREGAVLADQGPEVTDDRGADEIDVEEREEHRDVGGNPGRCGGIESASPVLDQRLDLCHGCQQGGLTCSVTF